MIPLAIVAHKSRSLRAEKLADVLKAEFIATDDGTLGPGANHDVAWQWHSQDNASPWSVVLEDDAVPVKGFREQLAMALEAAPSPVVSLYLGRGRPPHVQPAIMRVAATEANWWQAHTLLHCVGVAIKTALIGDMLAERIRGLPIDESIGNWADYRQLIVSYCNPSIVDHDYRLPTTILERTSGYAGETGERPEVRKAWKFGKRDRWNSSAVWIPDPAV